MTKNWLKDIISNLGVTQYRFAKMCKINKAIINKIIIRDSNVENVSIKNIKKISDGLNISLNEFYDKYIDKKEDK